MLLSTVAALAALTLSLGSYSAQAAEINREGYSSAEICAYCHEDIHKAWSRSAHARAFTNPVFSAAYAKAYLKTKGEAKDICLRCHAPSVHATGDTDVQMPVTREGVTCDFCHTIEDIDLGHPEAVFKLDPGGRKRASMRVIKTRRYEDTPAAHQAAYSDWFNRAELCAGCHEVTNLSGIKLGETYTEWKNSGYAERGVVCQNCHMPLMPGKPVDPSVKAVTADVIPDHSLAWSAEEMHGAVELEVLSAKRVEGGGFRVELAITNVKAGHNIPTGLPSRRLTVSVTILSETGVSVTTTREFGKKVVGQDGKRLETDMEAFIDGVVVVENSSIKPEERRVAGFLFSEPPPGKVTVSASAALTYDMIVTTRESASIPLSEAMK